MAHRTPSRPVRPAARRRFVGALLCVLSGHTIAPALGAQTSPFERGVTAAGLLLRQLDGVKRVLMIAAHPDDEDTALLATLARGMGAETAYLSLTRGEGGQNLIGGELFEGLGVIRTGELLAARSLDGGRQFFTRAVDFGFSKSAEEAFSKWPREEVLHDVVWVVRSFRPHVVVSVFSGSPADGHGQHQAAGLLAREAFDAAGDPARFPEQLGRGVEAWQPLLLWGRPRGPLGPGDLVVEVETGRYDPLLGRSHFQLAMESRSRHSSQDMGVAQPMGPRPSTLVLLASAPGVELSAEAANGLFAGVDTTLAGLTAGLPSDAATRTGIGIDAYREAVHDAVGALGALEPWRAAPPLGRALEELVAASREARSEDGSGELAAALEGKRRLASRALLEVAGVVVDVRVGDDLLVPGQDVPVEVSLWNGGPYALTDAMPDLEVPPGWGVQGPEPAAPETAAVEPGGLVRWTYRVSVPEDAEPSRLYYLAFPRDGEMYRWPDDPSPWGLPRGLTPLVGGVRLSVLLPADGAERPVPAEALREAEYVGVDRASGEFRRPVLVVPELSVAIEPEGMIWPVGGEGARTVGVVLRSQLPSGATSGTVSLEAPEGWRVEPAEAEFSLDGEGATASVDFLVQPDAGVPAGRHVLRAVARTADGRTHAGGFRLLEYPHIEPAALFRAAEATVTRVPARVADGLRVGYVMGSGDAGPDALRQLGVDVELLGPREVREGDLSRFDALVLGVRAYETRPDLRAANPRVLDFARRGGTVVVQYNQYEFSDGGFAPYPLAIRRPHDRVTDEGAAVRLLAPEGPVLSWPNRITDEDFDGWVTERGLYFAGEWDPRYTPLLEMADPGEEPLRGSLIVAPVGEGVWVYTGLSFFRQLPAGVPGAVRLFANLVSLRAADRARQAGDGP